MSPAAELVIRLRRLGISIEAHEGQLKVSAPRGVLSETLRTELGARKADVLAMLSQPENAELTRIARGGRLPVSRFQRQIWATEQLAESGEANHNLASAWRIHETTEAEILEAAIRDLLHRQEITRTVFEHEDGEPYALVRPEEGVAVERIDLTGQASGDVENVLRGAIEADLARAFVLDAEPAFRWRIYQTDAGLVLLVGAHHIAIDQWSFALLREELHRSLEAVKAGEQIAAPDYQYADFADWQRRSENGLRMAENIEWWADELADAPQLTLFPTDHNSGNDPEGAIQQFDWDKSLAEQIQAFTAREHVTPYMFFLAAWAAALSLHSGQKDLVLGCAFGTREKAELESVIGPFVNMLPMRVDLSDDPDMLTLVGRTRDAVLNAYSHRDVSLEALVQRLNPARSIDHQPIFQTSMIMHTGTDKPVDPIQSSGLMQHMICYARGDESNIGLAIEYRADRYERATIQRIARQVEALAKSMVGNPALKVSELSTLTDADRETVLETFNDTVLATDPTPFVTQFERRANEHPAWTAIRCGEDAMDSRALDARANAIAARLEIGGVRRGDRVGICMSRSIDMLAALLAVLKLGAAYVPLDPDFPENRLSFMAEDSALHVILTDDRAQDAAQAIAGVQLLNLDREQLVPSAPRISAAQPGDAAYVIYTSGSTGRPNGVVVPHNALSNFLASMARVPGLAAGNVLAAVTTISFDIATLELFLPLLTGATIELVPREIATDGIALGALIERSGANVLQATPATWRLLLAAGWRGAPNFKALCGGEGLPSDLAAALIGCVGELWNLYGPTETTVWSTAGRVSDPAAITVGKPIANTSVYILDGNGKLVAPGIAGEIVIGGEGVTCGYHNRDDLTATRFVPDPFRTVDGARMYHTGDIGRWNSAGEIVHMGRRDHQVKIRGFRIELPEIETALAAHPTVRQVVVVAANAGQENASLVAYCSLEPGTELTSSEARSFLRETLPPHMIPALFVMLEAIPLTPNGKVDRKALPDPYASARLMPMAFVAPSPGVEQIIAEIWKELLSIDRVGANDNFFDLGGHSLLSLRMSFILEDRTKLRIPPRMLFTQTLRQIANALVRTGDATAAG